eukprot:GFKZ01014673.1.p1 GENE.GFKZ01014673.1~~GFKZ01014673.1.p1  ORF type:complete len:706 (-),score=63.47 GFKZ01014673.1:1256-3373(-)
MFDLRRWLASVDISVADESLSVEAAQLLILNDSLVHEVRGPILASLIISSEEDRGLQALVGLATGSEPRFVAMALLNILYVLRMERSDDNEFSYTPESSESSSEITVSASDLPSEDFVRVKIASVMHCIAEHFLEKVSEGDFCPDFLIYLLTILMDLSKDCSKSPEIAMSLARLPSVRFLKAIIRTWKSADFSAHVSTGEPGDESSDELALGFLVTCYLRCIAIAPTTSVREEPNGALNSSDSAEEGDDEYFGIDAIISMDDWFIKFALMRIYQSQSSSSEREFLVSVLHECAKREASFGRHLVKLQFGSALRYCLKSWEEGLSNTGATSPEMIYSKVMKTIWQYFQILWDLSEQLRFGRAAVELDETLAGPSKIWFVILLDCLRVLVVRAFRILIWAELDANPSGNPAILKTSATSLILKSISLCWGVRNNQLRSQPSRAGRARLKSRFKNWSVSLEESIELCLHRQETSWERLSRSRDCDVVRRSLAICTGFSEERLASDQDESGRSEFICEWCLEKSSRSKRCGTCHRVWYCSAAHQRAHWQAGHRTECAFVRNSLEGCSFALEESGEIGGLIEAERQGDTAGAIWNEGAELSLVEKGQKDELVFLGFRLPGAFLHVYSADRLSVGVKYMTRGEFAHEITSASYDSDGDETRKLLRVCLQNCERNIRMQIVDRGGMGRRQIRIHFYGFDETHSLVTDVEEGR